MSANLERSALRAFTRYTKARPASDHAGRTCAECQENTFKYRCPACDIRTCSLACTRAHKQATGCTGKRSRTEMVTLAEFTERQLLSDYKFLEEAARLHDAAQRSEAPRPARQLPHGLQMFVNEVSCLRITLPRSASCADQLTNWLCGESLDHAMLRCAAHGNVHLMWV